MTNVVELIVDGNERDADERNAFIAYAGQSQAVAYDLIACGSGHLHILADATNAILIARCAFAAGIPFEWKDHTF